MPVALAAHHVVPPHVAVLLPGHGRCGAAHDQHLLQAGRERGGLVGVLLEVHGLATPVPGVRGNQELALRVVDPVGQGGHGKPAEHHAVNRPDAGAGEHGDHRFGNQGQVEGHAVARLHAQFGQGVRGAAHLAQQFGVGEGANFSVLAFPDDGAFAPQAARHVAVQGVVGHVRLAAHEPLRVGRLPVQHLGPGREPVQFLGHLGPELVGLLKALAVAAVVFLAGHAGLRGELGAGGNDTRFVQHVVDVVAGLGHAGSLLREMGPATAGRGPEHRAGA